MMVADRRQDVITVNTTMEASIHAVRTEFAALVDSSFS